MDFCKQYSNRLHAIPADTTRYPTPSMCKRVHVQPGLHSSLGSSKVNVTEYCKIFQSISVREFRPKLQYSTDYRYNIVTSMGLVLYCNNTLYSSPYTAKFLPKIEQNHVPSRR
jgi:hypothetical protein